MAELEALLGQPVEHGFGAVGVVHDGAFGDLQAKRRRLDPMAIRRAASLWLRSGSSRSRVDRLTDTRKPRLCCAGGSYLATSSNIHRVSWRTNPVCSAKGMNSIGGPCRAADAASAPGSSAADPLWPCRGTLGCRYSRHRRAPPHGAVPRAVRLWVLPNQSQRRSATLRPSLRLAADTAISERLSSMSAVSASPGPASDADTGVRSTVLGPAGPGAAQARSRICWATASAQELQRPAAARQIDRPPGAPPYRRRRHQVSHPLRHGLQQTVAKAYPITSFRCLKRSRSSVSTLTGGAWPAPVPRPAPGFHQSARRLGRPAQLVPEASPAPLPFAVRRCPRDAVERTCQPANFAACGRAHGRSDSPRDRRWWPAHYEGLQRVITRWAIRPLPSAKSNTPPAVMNASSSCNWR